jgi:hypothetical protein
MGLRGVGGIENFEVCVCMYLLCHFFIVSPPQKSNLMLRLMILRIEREFIEEYYELHRRDALAMERLTFSPYVLDIYGYCGQSAINELANFGIEGMSSLEKIARSFRGMDDIEPVSKIKLQLASMVSIQEHSSV